MLDLKRLNTFREVATRHSFSAAADELDYTQSSVSQQITSLERELGVELIDRSSRPVTATTHGEFVLSQAATLLTQASGVERQLALLSRGEAGNLRLGGFFTAWATFIPAAVSEFTKERPEVRLEMRQLEPTPALRALDAGDLDAAVVYSFGPAEEREGYLTTHLIDDQYAVALPAGHRLSNEDTIELADLADEVWVSPPAEIPYARIVRDLCGAAGFEPDIVYETADVAMAQPLVAAGLAVTLLPSLGLVPKHQGVVARPLASAPPARSVDIVYPAAGRQPAAAAMTKLLVEKARAWQR